MLQHARGDCQIASSATSSLVCVFTNKRTSVAPESNSHEQRPRTRVDAPHPGRKPVWPSKIEPSWEFAGVLHALLTLSYARRGASSAATCRSSCSGQPWPTNRESTRLVRQSSRTNASTAATPQAHIVGRRSASAWRNIDEPRQSAPKRSKSCQSRAAALWDVIVHAAACAAARGAHNT